MKKAKIAIAVTLIAVVAMLAALPSTMAWYSSQTYGKGAEIQIAVIAPGYTVDHESAPPAKAPLMAAKSAPAEPTSGEATDAPETGEAAEPFPDYEPASVTVLTLQPDGNASCGYMTVTVGSSTYYSELFELDDNGAYPPQTYRLIGIDPWEITDSSACWGELPLMPDDGQCHTLKDLESFLSAEEDARQAEYELLKAEAEEAAEMAKEEAARKAAEEAAKQAEEEAAAAEQNEQTQAGSESEAPQTETQQQENTETNTTPEESGNPTGEPEPTPAETNTPPAESEPDPEEGST